MKKRKIFKVLFIISFIPYIIFLIRALLSAFYGTADFGSVIISGLSEPWIGGKEIVTLYGFEAFKQTITWDFIGFTFGVPLIPIILLYQLIYLVIMCKNRKTLNNIKKVRNKK